VKKTDKGQSVSYYDVLQVRPGASDADIRSAYYRLAKRFHPDLNPQERRLAELRFRLINEAYAQLKTQDNRARYNMMLKKGGHTARSLKKSAGNDNRRMVSSSGQTGFLDTLSSLFGFKKTAPSGQ
jgi:curved DNA-binding protein